jgi:hypothetical protein
MAILALALSAVAAGCVVSATDGRAGLTADVAIGAIAASGQLPSWDSQTFADSLAVQLARAQGLTVRRGPSTRAEFLLDGQTAVRDHRLMLTMHLTRDGKRDTVWSASFWRPEAAQPGLVRDVANAVVEALYATVARRAMSAGKETR